MTQQGPLARARRVLAHRMRRVSLRRRLVLVVLALLLTSCAIIAAVTILALHHFLLDRLDQQLAAASTRYAISLEHPSDGDADNPFSTVTGQSAGTLGARVVNGTPTSVGLVPGAGDAATVPPAARAPIAALTAAPGPRSIELPGLGDYRVLTQPGRDGDLLVTGLPEHGVDETTQRLAVIEGLVFAVALLLTGTAGAISIRLSLRPLTRVVRTARMVADMPLTAGAVVLPKHPTTAAPNTEVGQVAEALNHMLDHIQVALTHREASEKRLRHFIADASHELRTPLAVIHSHAEHAQRLIGDGPEEITTALNRITTASERMGQLVDDLLLLARLDSGRPLAHDEVDLTRLVIDAVSDARATGLRHRWELDLPEEPVTLVGDEHRLHQAIANLLANARIHTPPGTTVSTRITHVAENTTEVRVTDGGPGIAVDVLPHIFERFTRADPARAHTNGSTGLGLAITEAIVHAHHGTIQVTSTPGSTAFTIHLPATPPHHEP
jgi:two-component system OmpR family sensor kinase